MMMGGAVWVFLSTNILVTKSRDLSVFIPHVFESIFIEIENNTNNQKPIIIGVIYRPNTPPRADLDKSIESISTIIDRIASTNRKAIIMGDLNIDLLKYGSHNKTDVR